MILDTKTGIWDVMLNGHKINYYKILQRMKKCVQTETTKSLLKQMTEEAKIKEILLSHPFLISLKRGRWSRWKEANVVNKFYSSVA